MAQTHPCIKEKSIAFSFDSLVFVRSGFSSFSFLFLWNATGFLFLEMGSHEPKKIVFPFSLWRCYIYIYTHICIEDPNHNQITSFHRLTNSIFCFLDVFDNSSSRCRRTPPVAGSIFVFPGFSKFISLSLSLLCFTILFSHLYSRWMASWWLRLIPDSWTLSGAETPATGRCQKSEGPFVYSLSYFYFWLGSNYGFENEVC